MRIGPIWLDWRDLSFSTRSREFGINAWRQWFAFRCGICRAFTFGCDGHWLCGLCPECNRQIESDAESD